MEKHDLETLHIKEIFDILVKQEPQIKLLKVVYKPHSITLKLRILRKRRNAYAQAIIKEINTKERAKVSGMKG